jgi:hypothetical protein
MLYLKGTDTYNQITAGIACDGSAANITTTQIATTTTQATTAASATPTSGGGSGASLLSYILGFSIILVL